MNAYAKQVLISTAKTFCAAAVIQAGIDLKAGNPPTWAGLWLPALIAGARAVLTVGDVIVDAKRKRV